MSKVVSIAAGRRKLQTRQEARDQARDALIVDPANLELVDRIARQIKTKVPACFDLDDLVGAGRVGLCHAARSFDPSRGVAFGAYARMRIKGEILESIGMHSSTAPLKRSGSHGTRSRRWAEAIRPPIAEHEWKPKNAGCESVLEDRSTPDPRVDLNDQVETAKTIDLIDEAIAALPERHAVLIELYYRYEVPMCEIAEHELFQLSRGRTSQIHGEALELLREYFRLRGQRAA